jgi:inhibitor of KinA sporulation pathway (predicted exonuclease)
MYNNKPYTVDIGARASDITKTITNIIDIGAIEPSHQSILDECSKSADEKTVVKMIDCEFKVEKFKKYYELKKRIGDLSDRCHDLPDITAKLFDIKGKLSEILEIDLKRNRREYYLEISRIEIQLDGIKKKLDLTNNTTQITVPL